MALTPRDIQHALQVEAGINGRLRGHEFENELVYSINNDFIDLNNISFSSLFTGSAHNNLINKALSHIKWDRFDSVSAISLGSLATNETGKKWLTVHGLKVKACKSDLLLTFTRLSEVRTIGVSVKQCNNKTPTNAQLYFTTATAFCRLLDNNNIPISAEALTALRQFCGDTGFRPLDCPNIIESRSVDPRRFFWEEIDSKGKKDLEQIFTFYQDDITRLLLQKAYLNDPFLPELLIHKTRKTEVGNEEYALYTIDELIKLSSNYAGFSTKSYSVRKGSYKDPEGIVHQAPRFGIVQMQRGGQSQHPTQLQFNLQAGYFYKI